VLPYPLYFSFCFPLRISFSIYVPFVIISLWKPLCRSVFCCAI
jgi:hypothetical protein